MLKGLLFLILFLLIINYFLNYQENIVTFSLLFIIASAIISLNEEVASNRNKEIIRSNYQIFIDRGLVFIFVVVSIDVLISLFVNGMHAQ